MSIESKITAALNKKIWIIPVLFGFMIYFTVCSIVAIELRGFNNLDSKFAFSVGGELFAMFVAVVLMISIIPAYKRHNAYMRVFVTLLTVGCFSLHLDIVQMTIDGNPNLIMLNRVACILVFFSETTFTFFFWLYVTYVLKPKGKVMDILSVIASVLLLVFQLLPFVNFFYPLYFTIDEAGVYHRVTETWWICRIYIVLICLFVIAALIFSKEPKKSKIAIIAFMGLPLISLGAGGFNYGVSILYSSMMVSLVLVYALLFSDNERHLYSTSKELSLATNIQKHMLPSIFPAFPDRKEFDVYASMKPAKEVGGDFYDFFLIDDTHLGLVIADVSDKGVPAALFMMASKIVVQNYAMMGLSPKEVLAAVNRQICSNNQDQMFITIWFGILDVTTGLLTASNGGHEKPVLKKPNGDFELYKDKHGFIVGWDKDGFFNEYQLQLEKGSKLFVFTDGVPEASNGSSQFSINRMVETLNKYKDLSPDKILLKMNEELIAFIGDTNQFDDITMLCLEYRGLEDEKH